MVKAVEAVVAALPSSKDDNGLEAHPLPTNQTYQQLKRSTPSAAPYYKLRDSILGTTSTAGAKDEGGGALVDWVTGSEMFDFVI